MRSLFREAESKYNKNTVLSLLTRKNNLEALNFSLELLDDLDISDYHDQEKLSLAFLMKRFTIPEAKTRFIENLFSEKFLLKASSYIGLRNFPDDHVMELIKQAIVSEENSPGVRKSDNKNILLNVLTTTLEILERNEPATKQSAPVIKGRQAVTAKVTSSSSDYVLAKTYAPILKLSNPGAVGVNLKLFDSTYPYTDYVPIDVRDIASNTSKLPLLYYYDSKNPIEVEYFFIELLGMDQPLDLKSSQNYIDFDYLLSTMAGDYKDLDISPTVYYKVFRNSSQTRPIAIQYWFFYYYNNWVKDHPGDWEGITVFFGQPRRSPGSGLFHPL